MTLEQNKNLIATEEFAQSKDWPLRLATAFNLNTPVRVLQQLIKDNYWEVRWAVAQNLNTPVHILEQLLEDNIIVAMFVK